MKRLRKQTNRHVRSTTLQFYKSLRLSEKDHTKFALKASKPMYSPKNDPLCDARKLQLRLLTFSHILGMVTSYRPLHRHSTIL